MIEVEFSGQNLENSADLADWRHPVDHIEPEEDKQPNQDAEMLATVLGVVFRSRHREKMDYPAAFNRFIALTWVIRPDLLGSKSLMALGEDIGVTRAALSKLAVQWSDMLGGYRNGGQKTQAARESYRAVQAGHQSYRSGPSSKGAGRTEERIAKLCGDFLEGRPWRRPDKELLRRRGFIGAGDQLTTKGKQWVESARYTVESGDPG